MQVLNRQLRAAATDFTASFRSDSAPGEISGALYSIQIWILLSVCLSGRPSGCLRLIPLPSQRNLFSTTQMFRAICCATLSCVYNKEVSVWRRGEGSEVEERVLLRRGGGHCAVDVNTERCQLPPWPPKSRCSMAVFILLPAALPFFKIFLRDSSICMLAESVPTGGGQLGVDTH